MPMLHAHAAMQPLQPWRFPSLRSLHSHCSNGDVSAIPHTHAYTHANALCSHAVMQPCSHAAMQSLMSWRFPSLHSLDTHCSNGDVSVMRPCSHAATLAMEISQSSQPMQPLQQWRYLTHTHAHACQNRYRYEINIGVLNKTTNYRANI